MKRSSCAISVLLLFLSGSALAGAWDVGPFDNDDALDWVWELLESDDMSVVKRTLQDAIDSSGYLEAPTASMAIAAAEVVAALKGNPRAQLPAEVIEWIGKRDDEIDEDIVAAARQAIAQVVDTDSSELAQLWMDSAEMATAWRSELANLEQRLK